MKKGNENNRFRLLLFLLLLASLPGIIYGQSDRTKTIKKSFSGKDMITVEHRHGPLRVLKSSNNQFRVDLTLEVEAKNEGDLQIVFDHFDLTVKEQNNHLRLITDFEVKNWNTNNEKTQLVFEDGKKVKDLKGLKISMDVYVPEIKELALSNKYEAIEIEDGIQAKMNVTLYSGRFKAGDINAPITMTMKYSKGDIGNFEGGNLELYDCDMGFGNSKWVSLKSKYSKINMGNTEELKIESYDDKIEVGNVNGDVMITDKYSTISLGDFNNSRMEVYDSDIDAEDGKDLFIKSKYSKFKFGKVNSINFESSNDDNIDVKEIGSLSGDAKYTEFAVGSLHSKLDLISYDNKVEVDHVIGPLEELNFDGKYGEMELNFDGELDFQIDALLKYGKLQFDEDDFDLHIFKENNDELEIKGKKKGSAEDSPKVIIKSHDVKIIIN